MSSSQANSDRQTDGTETGVSREAPPLKTIKLSSLFLLLRCTCGSFSWPQGCFLYCLSISFATQQWQWEHSFLGRGALLINLFYA